MAAKLSKGENLEELLHQRKEPRTGNPLEIAMLLYELSQSPDPLVQFMIVFFAVTIGVPFFGGLVILFLDYTKEDIKGRPRRAFSWIPFMGCLLELYWSPLLFLEKQFKWFGFMFSVDTIVRETTCLYGQEGMALFSAANSPLQKSTKNKMGQLLFLGNQMGSFFDPHFKANMQLYNSIASTVLNDSEFNAIVIPGLEEYVGDKLESLSSSNSLGKKRRLDLFSLSSCMYLHSLIYTIFGHEFALAHADELVDELHQTQLNMKFTFVRFIGSFGVPTGSSQHTDKLSQKFTLLVEAEIAKIDTTAKETKSTYLAHLVAQKLPEKANDFVWSHIAHLILSSHAQFVSSLSWTFYNIQRLDLQTKPLALSFKKACISESARRYAPAMTSKTISDKVVLENGCVLYPGMTVFACPASVYLDAKRYKDPLKWNPDRWSTTTYLSPFDKSLSGLPHSEHLEKVLHVCLDLFLGQSSAGRMALQYAPGQKDNLHDNIDYWATLAAPWSRTQIMLVMRSESGKDDEDE